MATSTTPLYASPSALVSSCPPIESADIGRAIRPAGCCCFAATQIEWSRRLTVIALIASVALVGIAAIYSGYAFGSPHAGMSPAAVGVLATSIGVAGLVGIVKSSIDLHKLAQESLELERLRLTTESGRTGLTNEIRTKTLKDLMDKKLLWLLQPNCLVGYALLGSATKERYTEIATIAAAYKKAVNNHCLTQTLRKLCNYPRTGTDRERFTYLDDDDQRFTDDPQYQDLEQRFVDAKAKIWPPQAASQSLKSIPLAIPVTIFPQHPSL